MTNITQYVTEKFGSEAAQRLKRIRTGGDNNRKGTQYEDHLAVSKLCEICDTGNNLDEIFVSSQVEGFVDDLCIEWETESIKENFQAKNSTGASANWSLEIQERFEMQAAIDLECLGYCVSRQILTVSCMDTAEKNQSAIPKRLKSNCLSVHFPFYQNAFEQITKTDRLRKRLERMCHTEDLSVIDSAFRYILGAWHAGNERRRSTASILGEAKRMARPNVFADNIPENRSPPEWLYKICAFHGMNLYVEYAHFIIGYNGLRITVGENLMEPTTSELDSLCDKGTFFAYIMNSAVPEL